MKRVKMGSLSGKERENALNQIRILASIHHPNVVGYKAAFIDEGSKSLWYNSQEGRQHCDGICNQRRPRSKNKQPPADKHLTPRSHYLANLCRTGPRTQAAARPAYFSPRYKGNDQQIQTANVFLYEDDMAKLGDMNVSKISEEGLAVTQTGTPYYASPEVWKDQPYD